jgi:hypothetical protein
VVPRLRRRRTDTSPEDDSQAVFFPATAATVEPEEEEDDEESSEDDTPDTLNSTDNIEADSDDVSDKELQKTHKMSRAAMRRRKRRLPKDESNAEEGYDACEESESEEGDVDYEPPRRLMGRGAKHRSFSTLHSR